MKKLFLSALIILISNPVLASKEMKYDCPSIEKIKSNGLEYDSIYYDGTYYTVHKNDNYESPYHWTFQVWGISASSKDDAFNKANDALASLSGTPQAEYANGFMDCVYNNEYGYVTEAYTKYIG